MNRTLYEGIYAQTAPEHILATLLRRGRTNRYSEPMYRLVRTDARRRISWGIWHDWQASISIKDRNAYRVRALKTSFGVRHVPMYPGIHGWSLERYREPEAFGSRQQWYLPQSMGGTLRWLGQELGYVLSAGHFPHMGDWEGTGYIFPVSPLDGHEDACAVLSEALIANAVGRLEVESENQPCTSFMRARMEIYAAECEEQRREAEFTAFAEAEYDEALQELQVQTPEARGEVGRNIEKMGIREHPWD